MYVCIKDVGWKEGRKEGWWVEMGMDWEIEKGWDGRWVWDMY